MATRTVLFDLGDVLVRFSHDRMCRQIGDVSGLSAGETRKLLLESGLQWDFERGRLDLAGFHARWKQLTGRTVDPARLARASGDIFEPQPGMDRVVARLADAGIRLVVLSNTCVTHVDWIREHVPLFARFDDYVLSYEVGSLKPEPAIYEAALERIGCEPDECLFTDDRPENVEAALEFGLDAVRFEGVVPLRATLAARGLPVPSENGPGGVQ